MTRDDPLRKAVKATGVRPSKGRGQNFLRDNRFAAELVQFSGIVPDDNVLEIGPGTGVLTREILAVSKNLKVVEIETGLAQQLTKNVPGLSREQILNRDVRELKVEDIFPGKRVSVLGNVPYSISSDLLFWVIENRDSISRSCFLMQKEFALRVAAAPGGRDYGTLSVLRELYAEAEIGSTISGDQFYPPAAVDSTVIKLTMRPHQLAAGIDETVLRSVLRAAFGQRRKTLQNSLTGSGLVGDRSQVERWLAECQIDGKRRAETLALKEFARLAEVYQQQFQNA